MNYHETLYHYQPLFKKGSALISKHMFLHEELRINISSLKPDIEKGIELLTQAIEYIASWQAYWIIGKGHQRLKEHQQAANAFQQAWDIAKYEPYHVTHCDILRELGLELSYLKKFDDARVIAKEAIKLEPNDPGLQANYAFSLLLIGDTDGALEECQEAYNRNPEDKTTKGLLDYIKAVTDKKIPIPKSVEEVLE